jgi:signal transduction histidine kinase
MGGMRGRTTAAAAAVVGVALALGGLVLVFALRLTLTGQVTDTARLRAAAIVELLDAGSAPADLTLADEEDWLAQVVNADGFVVAATPRLAGRPPVARLHAGDTARVRSLPASDGCPCLLLATPAAGGRYEVLVAQTMDPITEGTTVLILLLTGGIPILVAVTATTTWMVAGRTLAPVEAIRRRVGEITERDLTRRIPQNAGDDEIARLAGTMNEMLARLEHAQNRQRRFVSDASHELRSPLTTVRHELEVALSDPDAVDVSRLAADLLTETLRQQSLVDDLLALARADEAGSGPSATVDLDDLVFAEARRIRDHAGITVDTRGVGAGRVLGDPAGLSRMLRNLVDNAQRHARSAIRLRLSERDGGVRLTVANDGPPIAPEHRAQIFERFARLDDARTRDDGGAGLGLAIVAAIVAAHRGTVHVETEDGWTRFVVELPAVTD